MSRRDIIRSAENLRTKTKDQFPLEIFVFGESIPYGDRFNWSSGGLYEFSVTF
jgi:hypothetical protein